jgi:hypothetical protein
MEYRLPIVSRHTLARENASLQAALEQALGLHQAMYLFPEPTTTTAIHATTTTDGDHPSGARVRVPSYSATMPYTNVPCPAPEALTDTERRRIANRMHMRQRYQQDEGERHRKLAYMREYNRKMRLQRSQRTALLMTQRAAEHDAIAALMDLSTFRLRF